MKFVGISRVFSTVNSGQFERIGAFWNEMSGKYGIGNLRGLGYNWTNNSIEYVIGLKEGLIEGANAEIELPDDSWITVCGRTENIAAIYDEIYRDGCLKFEIESFTEEGDCEIQYCR